MDESEAQSLIDLIVAFDLTPYLPASWQPTWQQLQAHPVLMAILFVIVGYLVGRALKLLIHEVLDRLLKGHIPAEDYEIAHYLTSPVLQTSVALSIIVALATLNVAGAVEQLAIQVCFTGLLVLWGRAWFKATRVILRALEAERDRYHLFQPRTIPFFEMTIKLLLVGVLTYLMFLVWDIDATAWVASAGIIGIVVGFAARDTLANLISGVSIVADAPYKIGDYIVLDTGERGLVTHLGIRSTRILTRDDIEVSIPNAVIGSTKVINESGGPRVRHRIRIPVGVAYSSDMRKVIEVLEGIANAHETVADDPAPRVRVRGFGDNSINVELLVWIRRPAERGQTVHELALEIIEQFRAANISIPFPQRDLHWVNGATGDGALPLKP
jgi:small-conductance mechanosensitive channel